MTKGLILAGIVIAMMHTATPKTFAAEIQDLGEPCRARQVLAGRAVMDRATGKELFVITNMNEVAGMELIFIDFADDTSRIFRAPAGQGSWALLETPRDRLIVGTYYDGHYMVFDLAKMEFAASVGFPGEDYIWNLALGKDGRVYGGTYPGGKLGAFDLEANTVEDCGAPAPPNLYLRNVASLPDGRILCSFGTAQPTQLLYEPAMKQFSPLSETLQGATDGVTWNGLFLAGARVFRGEELAVIEPPFPVPPPEAGGWYVDTYTTTQDTLVLRQGNAVYRYKVGDTSLTKVCDIDLRGGRLLAVARDGSLLGVRGQEYFVVKTGDMQLSLKRIPGEQSPRNMLFLKADARGRVWGGPTFGQTLFHLDPVSGAFENTSSICDGGGEVYDAAFINGRVYAAAYSGGDIVEYDPDQPWDQWNLKNPRSITALGSRGYIRPIGGIIAGADGKLYSGWMAKYGTYGGAIAITDPKSGETELIENPLGEAAISGLAVVGQRAYIGTSTSANGLPNNPNMSVRFGVVDLTSRKVIKELTFDKTGYIDHVAVSGALVAFSVDGKIRIYDTVKDELAPEFNAALPSVSARGVIVERDGSILYGHEKDLVRLNLATGVFTTVAELPKQIEVISQAADGQIFAACGTHVYRVVLSKTASQG